jgi:hypothetical protein
MCPVDIWLKQSEVSAIPDIRTNDLDPLVVRQQTRQCPGGISKDVNGAVACQYEGHIAAPVLIH